MILEPDRKIINKIIKIVNKYLQHPGAWEHQVLSPQHEMSIPDFAPGLICLTWKSPQDRACHW